MKKLLFVIFIFVFALTLRLWNLNQMGRTWDEAAYVELGYKYIELFKKGDFSNSYWYEQSDEPPLVRYVYGLVGSFDISHFDSSGKAIFRYDYTYSRFASIVAASLSAIFVVLIGWEYISIFVGVIGGIIFSMLPFFLGLSQLATLESFVMLFFTASVYSFLKLLKKISIWKIITTGILIGFAVGVKYTNILSIPLLTWISLLAKPGLKLKYLLLLFLVSFLAFFALWPTPWFHLDTVVGANYEWRVLGSKYSIPEVFFGRLMLVPKFYYIVQFLITTPLLVLGLFLVGLRKISQRKKWILYVLVAWFLIPFLLSFYNFRQHGVRYIIEIYAPLSLIAAFGFDSLMSRFPKSVRIKVLMFIPLVLYLSFILFRITPYYLDYFNELVGGTKNVYEKQLFQLGWWGQGAREAGIYLEKNAQHGSTVGLAIMPIESMPPLAELEVSKYDPLKTYDYVVVSHFNIIREGFDDSAIRKNYKLIYQVKADGATLVFVYRH